MKTCAAFFRAVQILATLYLCALLVAWVGAVPVGGYGPAVFEGWPVLPGLGWLRHFVGALMVLLTAGIFVHLTCKGRPRN